MQGPAESGGAAEPVAVATPPQGGCAGTVVVTPLLYREIRERIGTQAQVAALLGVSARTVARRETRKMRITREASLALMFVERSRCASTD